MTLPLPQTFFLPTQLQGTTTLLSCKLMVPVWGVKAHVAAKGTHYMHLCSILHQGSTDGMRHQRRNAECASMRLLSSTPVFDRTGTSPGAVPLSIPSHYQQRGVACDAVIGPLLS